MTDSQNNPCPVCGSLETRKGLTASGFDHPEQTYTLLQCLRCSLVFSPPEPELSLKGSYSKEYYGSEQKKFVATIEKGTKLLNFFLARKIFRQLRRIAPDKNQSLKILDIGCGRGHLLNHFRNLGCVCHGVERLGAFPTEIRNGIHFYDLPLKDIAFPARSFDAVVLWHVLEHLTDPLSVLQEVERVLKPEGTLWIAVPNFGSFQSKLFKKHWFHLDLPRHRWHFTRATLQALLVKTGFHPFWVSTFSFEQNIYGFIQSAMNLLSFRESPQVFYECLKHGSEKRKVVPFIKGSITALFLSLFALLELIVSSFLNRGAVLIFTCGKSSNPKTK